MAFDHNNSKEMAESLRLVVYSEDQKTLTQQLLTNEELSSFYD